MMLKSRPTAQINKAVRALAAGRIIIYPTETVYGLGVAAFNAAAVAKLRALKKSKKPWSVAVSGFEQVGQLTEKITPHAVELIRKYWPGPLALVFLKNKKVTGMVTAGEPTVGIRWHKQALIQAVIKNFGQPIVATSANLPGMPPPRKLADIDPALIKAAAVVLKDDHSGSGVPSTVVDVSRNKIKVLREGPVKIENSK